MSQPGAVPLPARPVLGPPFQKGAVTELSP
jgi:hypothetical protein